MNITRRHLLLTTLADPRDIERPVVAPSEPISEPVELPHWTEPATGQVPQILRGAGIDRELLHDFLRSWAVKGFFLAFMISIVPGNWEKAVAAESAWIAASPVHLSLWLIWVMFMIDVTFATVGYVLTLKPLDAPRRPPGGARRPAPREIEVDLCPPRGPPPTGAGPRVARAQGGCRFTIVGSPGCR